MTDTNTHTTQVHTHVYTFNIHRRIRWTIYYFSCIFEVGLVVSSLAVVTQTPFTDTRITPKFVQQRLRHVNEICQNYLLAVNIFRRSRHDEENKNIIEKFENNKKIVNQMLPMKLRMFKYFALISSISNFYL